MATTTSALVAPVRVRTKARARTTDWRTRYFNWFCGSVLFVFGAIWAIPLIWAVDTSFKPDGEIALKPTDWWSSHFTLDAYRVVFRAGNIQTWYLNSFVISLLSAVLAIVSCSMMGFALAMTRFRGRAIAYAARAIGLTVPPQLLIVPWFQEFRFLHLLNTYWALILPVAQFPICVFIFAAFFKGIPTELADSAHVDGASWFQIYRSIYMPLTKPAISAVFIFIFVWRWNEFLWPLLAMTNTRMFTLPVGLAQV